MVYMVMKKVGGIYLGIIKEEGMGFTILSLSRCPKDTFFSFDFISMKAGTSVTIYAK